MRPRSRRPDPYAVLGVPPGATRAEIRQAYRQRAMEAHPDLAGVDATARMAEINEAREALLGRTGDELGSAAGGAGDGPRVKPRRHEPPPWAAGHASAWADHWSAWNDLPDRARPEGDTTD